MPNPLRLDDFGAPPGDVRSPSHIPDLDAAPAASPPTDGSLVAFDKGYAAGWDDATAAAKVDLQQQEAALLRHLEDLGFTYHEARAHVMSALTPLLRALLEKLLPDLLHQTLVPRLLAECETLVDDLADAPVQLMVAPDGAAELRRIIGGITALPLHLVEEPSVAAGRMYLRLGAAEREIDLAGARAAIAEALSALDDLNRETLRHG
ncbi:flagellar biosynthesis protein [Oceaniglobus roseus]|uniref:flagellar biosynthesis protein n=1 Tax=Oceaniglobus roseus TaxID=1737570 RepID=UPI000C7F083B|nr:flagellar biosynthesis protein [Kandeliimicrobium roseum]